MPRGRSVLRQGKQPREVEKKDEAVWGKWRRNMRQYEFVIIKNRENVICNFDDSTNKGTL